MDTVITRSADETFELGEKFAKTLKSGNVVCLYGELGSGKTTLVKGVARGLGIKRRIISPTFMLVRTYQVENNQNKIKRMYHLDLYRLHDGRDLESIGFSEILQDKDATIFIEWAEKARDLLPKKRINLSFGYVDENHRSLLFNGQ